MKYERAKRKGVVFNGSNNGRAFLSVAIMNVEIIIQKKRVRNELFVLAYLVLYWYHFCWYLKTKITGQMWLAQVFNSIYVSTLIILKLR